MLASLFGCATEKPQPLDKTGMVYKDSDYRSIYANVFDFDNYDGQPMFAVAFLGYGDRMEEVKQIIASKKKGEPEKKTNYLSYNGVEYEISAATLTEANSLYTFTFTNTSGKDLVLTAPDFAFGGDAYGFSQSPDFTVSYDGKVLSKANGNNGTMTAYYKVMSQVLELDFTDYDKLNFNYTGAVTVK